MPGRLLPLEGGVNFRDLGGYPTTDGRRVKWNRLFRSGQLSDLTDRDIEYLSGLDIVYCCDFRGQNERRKDPSRLPDNAQVMQLAIDPGQMESYVKPGPGKRISIQCIDDMMRGIYIEFASSHVDEFSGMFRRLFELERGAMLIHCSAGKDRTGFGSTLLLSALGVPREIVVEDYLLSGKYFVPEQQVAQASARYGGGEDTGMDRASVLAMLGVKSEYILGALNYMEDNHGTIERYLEERFSISAAMLEDLRQRFTE